MRIKINPRFAMLAGINGTQASLVTRPSGKAKRPKKAKTPEEVTQSLVEKYLDALGLQWFHMPPFVLRAAFAHTNRAAGAELGAMSRAAAIVRGLPDLLIWDPRRPGLCLPIELKTEAKDSKLSAAQRQWRTAIGTREARSFEEAKAIIDAWQTHPLPLSKKGTP